MRESTVQILNSKCSANFMSDATVRQGENQLLFKVVQRNRRTSKMSEGLRFSLTVTRRRLRHLSHCITLFSLHGLIKNYFNFVLHFKFCMPSRWTLCIYFICDYTWRDQAEKQDINIRPSNIKGNVV